MIGLDVKINNSFRLNTASATIAEVKKGLKGWAIEVGVPYANRTLAQTLRQEPGPAKHPIQWASERQRRYVMAKLRRQGNLPYQRSHQLARAWEGVVVFNANGGLMLARNPSGIAGYVYAPYEQQPFHRVTGWQDTRPVFAQMGAEQAASLIGYWPAIVHESVFK